MSTYVISDLHGCKEEFDAMLELIDFRESDEMWVIGDVCDRGRYPIALLQQIMNTENIHFLYGNHELWLEEYAQELIDINVNNTRLIVHDALNFNNWVTNNGGFRTVNQFVNLRSSECYDIKLFLEDKKLYQYLTLKGKKYLLMHAGIQQYLYYPNLSLESLTDAEMLWTHIDIDENPFEDVTLIVGHTPTFLYGEEYDGKIIKNETPPLIHIDCGCVYGRTLGCLRLDDMEEFYIPSTYERI